MYGVVYKITNTVNGKVYIGQTVRKIQTRWRQHVRGHEKCFRLKAAIRKYGAESFTVEKIDEAGSAPDLNLKESQWIVHYNSSEVGYNVRKDAHLTEEMRRKISIKNKGKKLSVEAKERMIQGMKRFYANGGKPWNAGTRKPVIKPPRKPVFRGIPVPVYQYNKCGKLIRKFDYTIDAARALIKDGQAKSSLASTASNLRTAANTMRGIWYGSRWSFEPDAKFKEEYVPDPRKVGARQRVMVVTDDGMQMEFESVTLAAEHFRLHGANIIRSCKTGVPCGPGVWHKIGGRYNSVSSNLSPVVSRTGVKFSDQHKLNLSLSHRGIKSTPEARAKIGIASKNRWKDPTYLEKMKNKKPCVHTPESKRKVAEAHAIPIVQLDSDRRELARYESASDAKRRTGYSQGNISLAARTGTKAYGCFWQKLDKSAILREERQ